ncbi:NACHT and WD repeat domain-containing protein 2-like [Lineus longissimus]|uniref:NACHT and WD repeat domain-containing protein 2-like n=1 Tax=Lineus longissimus TaxID=88925 RepID=UPI002B4DF65A
MPADTGHRDTKKDKTDSKDKRDKTDSKDKKDKKGLDKDKKSVEKILDKEKGQEKEKDQELKKPKVAKKNEKIVKVFSGRLGNLPPVGAKVVRIFTSSTFTDTTLERNSLMEDVYPRLKEFCREKYGLEFQVVDMRWGVRDEATDDHMTTDLCMQEIDTCQRLSMGPNFVVFLGQKYGYRPMPATILATEFDMICEVAKNAPSELELLKTWYQKDENIIPAIYVLQPVSSILTNYNNKRHVRLQEADQNLWWETMGKICRILRKCAYALHLTKKLDKQQLHNYFMSVTEREVERGVLQQENNVDHCIAFVRYISNVNVTALKFASRFMDFSGRNLDDEASKFLKSLRDERLPKKLPESNCVKFDVEWSGREGIEPGTHQEYLATFCKEFHDRIVNLVDRAVKKHEQLSSDTVFTETLQHLHACEKFVSMFQGREDVVEKVHQYICGKSQQPLVLFGESGCGKTSLLAKSASMVCTWLGKCKPIMVLRFLGTSPDSSTLMPLLTSICQQISFMYDQPKEDIPDELSPLSQYFKKLLECATTEMPLVLYLDSLDQLSGAEGAHQLAWLPTALPEHVKVVVSTLPNYYKLLDTLRGMMIADSNFVQVTPLGPDLGSTILKSWLKNANRQIAEFQWVTVNEAISKCNLPLFVRLVFDEICRWRSYNKPSMTQLSHTIHDIIMKLFDRIEIQHGRTLVSHALGYITASKSGISEAELEDLLSLDEKVLNDVYQYHIPPVRRIPPLLWTRIRNDMPGYLSERQADDINVIDWYHRQFIEASKERYFRNLNFASELHSSIAEFYRGTYAGVPKPFEYTERQRQMFHLADKDGESDRRVPAQPLVFRNEKGEVTRYNLRKLNELPYHLIRSHRYEILYDEVLFNYKWLHAKLSCMPLQSVLADFEDAMNHIKDKDIKLVADAIRLSSSVLVQIPSMIGPQIIGRLLPYYSRNRKINSLIQQCDTDGLEDCALVPSHHCLHTPGGPLQFSLEGHQFAPFGIAITSDAKYLVSVSNRFIIWDLATADVFRIVTPGIEGIMQNLVISQNDKYAVSFTNINQVIICCIPTGEYKRVDKPVDGKDPILGTSITTTHFAVWSISEWCLYTVEGNRVSRTAAVPKIPIVTVDLKTEEEVYVIANTGDENESEMTLEVRNTKVKPFDFHSSIVLNKKRDMMLCNIGISENALVIYKLKDDAWTLDKSFDNTDKILGLTLSPDENYIVATTYTGYKKWNILHEHMKPSYMKLPTGIRNIPQKNQLTNSLVTFTKDNRYMVAGVRKNLYVWSTVTGELYKVLDAHFGRIIAIASITHSADNIIVSSSMDKSIKVWNFDNIMENVNTIQRMEKPVDTISIAANAYVGATVARNCVGIWNLETGELKSTLAHTGASAIVSHALITANAEYVVSAESGNVLIWDVEKEKMIKMDPQKDVLMLLLTEEDQKYIAVSKAGPLKACVMCRSVPQGEQVYTYEYLYKGRFKSPVISKDGIYLVVPANEKKGADILSLYHAKTGTHMYNMSLKYANYLDYKFLVAMPDNANHVAIIDEEKGNIWDIKKKTFLRSVMRWNGQCMSTGKIGLFAPNRGGLEMIELKHGKTKLTLLPKVAEGVFSVMTLFTKNDQHVLYYHSGHRTVRVFRVSDGKQIANYKAHADLKDMVGTQGGASVVLCAIDGSVTTLTIADPADSGGKEILQNLRGRMELNFSPLATPQNSPNKTSTTILTAPAGSPPAPGTEVAKAISGPPPLTVNSAQETPVGSTPSSSRTSPAPSQITVDSTLEKSSSPTPTDAVVVSDQSQPSPTPSQMSQAAEASSPSSSSSRVPKSEDPNPSIAPTMTTTTVPEVAQVSAEPNKNTDPSSKQEKDKAESQQPSSSPIPVGVKVSLLPLKTEDTSKKATKDSNKEDRKSPRSPKPDGNESQKPSPSPIPIGVKVPTLALETDNTSDKPTIDSKGENKKSPRCPKAEQDKTSPGPAIKLNGHRQSLSNIKPGAFAPPTRPNSARIKTTLSTVTTPERPLSARVNPGLRPSTITPQARPRSAQAKPLLTPTLVVKPQLSTKRTNSPVRPTSAQKIPSPSSIPATNSAENASTETPTSTQVNLPLISTPASAQSKPSIVKLSSAKVTTDRPSSAKSKPVPTPRPSSAKNSPPNQSPGQNKQNPSAKPEPSPTPTPKKGTTHPGALSRTSSQASLSSKKTPSPTPTQNSISTIDSTVFPQETDPTSAPTSGRAANGLNGTGTTKQLSLGAAMHVARAVGKAKILKNQKSRACVVS